MQIDYEAKFRQAIGSGLNLFIGSGFCRLATDRNNHRLPTGNELKEELITDFKLAGTQELSLAQLAAILDAGDRDEFYSFLNERFSVAKFDPRYQILDSDRISLKAIFTTNIDDLVLKIFSSSTAHYINDIAVRGPTFSDRQAIDFVALHGSIIHEGEPLAFSTLDIAASFSADPDRWHFLTDRLRAFPTLFWGYSLQDAGVLQAINPKISLDRVRVQNDKWLILFEDDAAARTYFQALGFHIIVASTEEMLNYLAALCAESTDDEAESVSSKHAHPLPEAEIPAPGSTPVRPLIEFYAGAAPVWHDIYTGKLPRTKYYHDLINLIYSGKNAVVIGIAACGKTTLMMQVAASIEYSGHKLVLGTITKEKARLIVNKLGTDKALCFMDDFADSIEAFQVLLEAPNIQAIGFDRDYVFELGSHILDRRKYEVMDITELNDFDIQQIYSSIPSNLRREKLYKPRIEADRAPSIYEVFQTNVLRRMNLYTRYENMLNELLRQDVLLHDLLVMTCYVHSCRVPVSYDTASAFLRGSMKGYKNIESMLRKLGSIVTEYIGNLVDEDQDYFIPRSLIVSETILDAVQPQNFKRVLIRFHDQVSPFRITRFDIFRRKGFDANIMEKAFSDWKEGMDFYERLYSRDQSPYLRQQGALYLKHKRRYQEAFRWIDEAILLSRGRIPSIRNTHAIILFSANISLASRMDETDSTVRRTLEQSMSILSDCYRNDEKKTYHALTYAEQALRFHEVFADVVGLEYLSNAKRWLMEEKRRVPWNRHVDRLLRRINSRLENSV